MSQNNSCFGDYLHRINPNEFEVKDTTDTQMSASYLGLHFEIDNGGRLIRKLYTTNVTAHWVYISQLIPYS